MGHGAWCRAKERPAGFRGRRAVVFLVDLSVADSEGKSAIFFRKSVMILKGVTNYFSKRGLTSFPHHLRWGQLRAPAVRPTAAAPPLLQRGLWWNAHPSPVPKCEGGISTGRHPGGEEACFPRSQNRDLGHPGSWWNSHRFPVPKMLGTGGTRRGHPLESDSRSPTLATKTKTSRGWGTRRVLRTHIHGGGHSWIAGGELGNPRIMKRTYSLSRGTNRLSPWKGALIGLVAIKVALSVSAVSVPFALHYSGISYLLLLLLATGFSVRNGIQSTGRARPFWMLLAAGCGLWAFHQSLDVYYELGGGGYALRCRTVRLPTMCCFFTWCR